jgi:hypothetical protein
VHAAADNPNSCPIWAAHGPAGTAVAAPEIVLAPAGYGAAVSDPLPSRGAPTARIAHAFSARAPPASLA